MRILYDDQSIEPTILTQLWQFRIEHLPLCYSKSAFFPIFSKFAFINF